MKDLWKKFNTKSEATPFGINCILAYIQKGKINLIDKSPIYCKDFYQDLFWTQVTKQTMTVYGYTTKVLPEDLEEYVVFYGWGRKNAEQEAFNKKEIEEALVEFTKYCKELNWPIPTIIEHEDAYGITLNKDLVNNYSWIPSLWLLLFRLCFYITKEDFDKVDLKDYNFYKGRNFEIKHSYASIQPLDPIREVLKKVIKNPKQGTLLKDFSQFNIHSGSGVMSTFKK